MKRCPECNRTYSDESISFCLADGSLLSAPYDPSAEEAPPTEVIPATARPALAPTQPPRPPIPTITSFPGQQSFGPIEDNSEQSTKNSRAVLFMISAFAAVVILGIVLTVRYRTRNEPQDHSSLQTVPTATVNSTSPNATPTATTTSSTAPATRGTPQETDKKVRLDADPVLFPPDTRQPSTPTQSPTTDYNRIFRSGEVDQRARVLSKPEPSYTSEARTNQVAGIVVLRAVFSSSGQVTNISVIRGLSDGLTERAIAAAKQIKFVPAMKNGQPVSMWMQLEYNFNLY